jgi:hypothetical protein
MWQVLDQWHNTRGIDLIIQGGASGADQLANSWAISRRVPSQTYPADWSLGLQAGPLRNQQMLDEGRPDVVLAFPGRYGTFDMVCRAREAGIRVVEPVQQPATFSRRAAR